MVNPTTKLKTIQSVLIADGSSDSVLLPIIQRALMALSPSQRFADVEMMPTDTHDLSLRIDRALTQYQPDLLFVHRDAEKQKRALREVEIFSNIPSNYAARTVAVIPVRMSEAWLLIDEAAIRGAVNPAGTARLKIPKPAQLESCDAKDVLDLALRTAAQSGARRRQAFRPQMYRHRVADLQGSQSRQALLQLPSYKAFEIDLGVALQLFQNGFAK